MVVYLHTMEQRRSSEKEQTVNTPSKTLDESLRQCAGDRSASRVTSRMVPTFEIIELQ